MISTALGVRMHSGWGALVAVSFEGLNFQIVDRQRLIMADPKLTGSVQPYHAAAKLDLLEAEAYLARCYLRSEELAYAALGQLSEYLRQAGHRLTRAALLLASGRPLPELCKVLASHALIHTAEGELFRMTFRAACQRTGLAVFTFKEADLDEQFQNSFGAIAPNLKRTISEQGKLLGPPWTEDQKRACLAAVLSLNSGQE